MFEILLAAMMTPANPPIPTTNTTARSEETRICREMNDAYSRRDALKICRTRAEWRRWESCHGSVTRYCAPRKRTASLGAQTAFPLNADSRIVCKFVTRTGSRLYVDKMCMPIREWQRLWDESSATTADIQDKSIKIPGEQ